MELWWTACEDKVPDPRAKILSLPLSKKEKKETQEKKQQDN
jgi:hypothetical protein